MSDDEIVELFLMRSEAAISAAAEKYGARLRAVSMRIVRDSFTAEECENDAYLKLWELIPPHEPRSYLFAFAARIVRCISLNRVRSGTYNNVMLSEIEAEAGECIPSSYSVENNADGKALSEAVSLFLRKCSKEKRVVFVRRYWQCESIDEISSATGFSESKIKSILHRLRKELKVHLEKEGFI